METGLKLISDVFTQLAEQRWIFKYGNALFSKVNPKMIGETEEAVAKTPEIEVSVDNNENCQDAIQALQILGYNRKDIEKAFEKIANKDVSVEELIKKGLTLLSR